MNWVFQPINLHKFTDLTGDRTHDLASKIGSPNLSASWLAFYRLVLRRLLLKKKIKNTSIALSNGVEVAHGLG